MSRVFAIRISEGAKIFVNEEHIHKQLSFRSHRFPLFKLDDGSKDMADNQPPVADSEVLAKFASIDIGPGMTPFDTKNDTIKAALEKGIAEGEKNIDAKIQNFGMIVNGWAVSKVKERESADI